MQTVTSAVCFSFFVQTVAAAPGMNAVVTLVGLKSWNSNLTWCNKFPLTS